ncbi:Crp/Fnr family transcriptional regulator [Noviherbaspirillum aerium]|uniref:Crp/Fnr family transcriptional regulator n=1 Tax=Noviherbaspirillum aerium TaxID=2588497 RepID=UPI00124F6639|nr:Crp/Fnr family transcriptional regulator [Noviherbaspirillum aerium]
MARPTLATLRSVNSLSQLPLHELEALLAVVRWRSCEAGDVIPNACTGPGPVLFILSGYVKIVRGGTHRQAAPARQPLDRRTRPRHEVMVALLSPGNMLGEAAAMLGVEDTSSYIGLTPCQMVEVPREKFHSYMHTYPAFSAAVAAHVARRQLHAEQQLELMRGDLEGRIHALLRHCRMLGLDTAKWLSNAEIARMVGATRVAVSQVMGRIQHQDTVCAETT